MHLIWLTICLLLVSGCTSKLGVTGATGKAVADCATDPSKPQCTNPAPRDLVITLDSIATEPTNLSPIPFTATFSGPVADFAIDDIIITNGIPGNLRGVDATYTFEVSPSEMGTVAVDVAAGAAHDAAGNASAAAITFFRTYDGVRPEVTPPPPTTDFIAPTATLSSSAAAVTSASPIPIAIAFSEVVAGLSIGDFTIGNGVASNLTGSGTSYQIDVTPSGQGLVSITLGAGTTADPEGNATEAAVSITRTYDSIAPTITQIESPTADGSYKAGDIVTLQIVFDDVVAVTAIPHLKLETGTIDRNALYNSGSGTTTLTFLYTVTAGDTSADLDYVAINSLTVAGAAIDDAAGNNANLTLPAPGAAGSLAQSKTIAIDTAAPHVTAVSSSAADAAYIAGEVIDIRVSFDDAVVVTGTPRIQLETGSTDQYAQYASGSGSAVLIFNYTVQNGDLSSDLDYVAADALALNGGAIGDPVGNLAELTLPMPGSAGSLGSSKNIAVVVSPTILSVNSSTTDGTIALAGPISIQVNFSAAVTVTGTPQLTLETGLIDHAASYSSGSGTATLTFDYTVQPGDVSADLDYGSTAALSLNGGTIRQGGTVDATLTLPAPGAAGSLSSNKALVIVDAAGPTVTSVTSPTADGAYKEAGVIAIDVNFSEAVIVTGTPTLQLETGASDRTLSYESGSGTTAMRFSYTVQATDTAADLNYKATTSLVLAGGTIMDSASNNATLTLPALAGASSLAGSKALVVDTTAATVSGVSSSTANGSYNEGDIIDIRITFSEIVQVSGTPQISLETGTTDRDVGFSAGNGTTVLIFNYTIQAGDTSADLAYINTSSLALNGGTITDSAGNNATLTLAAVGAAGSLNQAKALVIDTTAPGSFSITAPAANVTTATPSVTWGASATASNYDLLIDDSSDCSSPVQTYTTITGTSRALTALPSTGSYYVCMLSRDVAGNTTTATNNQYTFYYDRIPTVTSVSSSTADGSYNQGAVVAIDITVSEPVTVTGTPRILMSTGGTTRYATYTTGTGTSLLTFNYTVAQGDVAADLDYASTAALALNGGTMKDQDETLANLTLTLPTPGAVGSVGNSKNIAVLGNPAAFTISTIVIQTGRATLYWVSPPTTASITIRRGTSTGSYPTTLSTSGTSPYLDTPLTNGTTYYYMVTAVNASGQTNATAEKSAMPVLFTADAGVDRTTSGTITLFGNNPYGVASRSWSQISGPGTVTFGTSTQVSTTVSADVDGAYVIRYSLTDAAAATATDDMTLTRDSSTPVFTSITLSSIASDGFVDRVEARSGGYLGSVLNASNYQSASYLVTSTSFNCQDYTVGYYHLPFPRARDMYDYADGNTYKICARLEHANGSVEFGDSPVITRDAVNPLTDPRSVKKIAIGWYHTCAILSDDSVRCWGSNGSGQLGLDSTTSQGLTAGSMASLPAVNLGAGRTAKAIAVGANYTCAILDTNDVKCWGYGSGGYGNLGYSDSLSRGDSAGEMAALPTVNLGAGRTAKTLSTGMYTTCVVLDDDTAKCWGDNSYGQLGQDDTNPRGGSAGSMAALSSINLGSGRTAKAIHVGESHTCAILDTDQVKCWGRNQNGILGYDDTTNRGATSGSMAALATVNLGIGRTAKALATGRTHSCAILDDNSVKCWGWATSPLGYDDTFDRGAASGTYGMANVVPVNLGVGRTAISIAANSSTCVVLDNATLKCWGANLYGQLGLDSDQDWGGGAAGTSMATLPIVNVGAGRTVQSVATTYYRTCAVLDDGTAKCWGDNSTGQLGYDETGMRGISPHSMADTPAINLGAGRTAVQITSKGSYNAETNCAILDNGELKCWGSNSYGQLGQGDSTVRGSTTGSMAALNAINLGAGRTAKAVTTGDGHVCAVLDTDDLKCWGYAYGLGLDSVTSQNNPASLPTVNVGSGRTVKMVAAGKWHTCAILDDDSLKCWGYNNDGQLGLDDLANRGLSIGSMATVPSVNLGPGRTATSLSVGNYHSCAILDDGSAKCWGSNSQGELGQDDTVSRGGTTGSMASLPPINLGSGRTAKKISAGRVFTCAILDNDTLKCWGGSFGGIGYDDTAYHGNTPGSMAALPTINLGPGRTAKNVVTGSDFTCVVLDNNSTKCWGSNEMGQLGLGDTATRGTTAGSMAALDPLDFGAGKWAISLSASYRGACAILNDNTMKCWGYNGFGQLGQDDTSRRGNGMPMSKALPIYFP